MKRWSNARGEGVLFSIDLLDGAGGEIRGTFFKDAAEKFFGILEEGKVGDLLITATRLVIPL
jgi:replication factor A1